jgi:hypothetical protein
VDFGAGAPIITSEGTRRKTNVFRIVLSHSRKAYSEATFTQTTEDFCRSLENAFAHFGGVPKTLVIDNLKAAVAHPDWFGPELTPKAQSFCRHYGTVILPTKPYMSRHKGKAESGVKYVKNNALKARTFTSLEEENRCLTGSAPFPTPGSTALTTPKVAPGVMRVGTPKKGRKGDSRCRRSGSGIIRKRLCGSCGMRR